MIIDIIVLLLALLAMVNGYRKGLIVAIFSFVGLIIVLTAGIPLSAEAVKYLRLSHSALWISIIVFLLVTIFIMFLMRWIAALVTTAFNWTILGLLNQLAGACLFLFIYITFLSILLLYIKRADLIPKRIIDTSYTIPYIEWWGYKSIEWLSSLSPSLKISILQ